MNNTQRIIGKSITRKLYIEGGVAHLEKFSLNKLFKFVVCNPRQSSPFLTILVPLWSVIFPLVFFHFSKLLFSGFLQLKGNFVRGQNKS